MPSANEPGASRSTAEEGPPRAGTATFGDRRNPRGFGRPSSQRRLGEVCPEVMLIMPFAVPLLLTLQLRKWLRRRLGRPAGNLLGKAAIIGFAGPPLLLAAITVLLMRLALTVLGKLDQVARSWRGA